MKQILIICISLALFSCQKKVNHSGYDKIKIDSNLDSPLFKSTESMLNPLTIKTKYGYDGLEDSTQYQIKSNILVNDDPFRTIRFTDLKQISSDTLEVNIYETNPMYHHELKIIIINKTFKVLYDFNMSGPIIETKIKTIKQELILKSIPKKTSDSLNGYINYLAKCESDCNGEIKINGYFKAKLE